MIVWSMFLFNYKTIKDNQINKNKTTFSFINSIYNNVLKCIVSLIYRQPEQIKTSDL